MSGTVRAVASWATAGVQISSIERTVEIVIVTFMAYSWTVRTDKKLGQHQGDKGLGASPTTAAKRESRYFFVHNIDYHKLKTQAKGKYSHKSALRGGPVVLAAGLSCQIDRLQAAD